jgi:SAM-dependent methyltransferase
MADPGKPARALHRLGRAGRAFAAETRGAPPAAPATRFWERSARETPPDELRGMPATDRLYSRLDEADLAEVRSRLDGDDADAWEAAGDRERKWLALAFGVHHGVPRVLEKTGLSAAMPPDDVHSMGRGSLAAGGAYYYGDLVADALVEAGAELRPGTHGLDFGCSSGRVVRVLAAAYPELEWHGCDPIESAVEWAAENLPDVVFAVSPQEPPLRYPDAAFDLAFAISIWSHYGERAAVLWLDEMHRVIKPGGHLVLTTHGYQSVAHYAGNGVRPAPQLAEIGAELYSRGFWFAAEFGEAGDWGIKSPQWGTAFLTPEWMLRSACPSWRIECFHPGRAEGNQDVFVLSRR